MKVAFVEWKEPLLILAMKILAQHQSPRMGKDSIRKDKIYDEGKK